ncbi:hypothetical protein PanWU01x14_009660 [Parasponia andersonii]|uniref:Uncharacterized protein n=1 Tax=Parasponia andersonii TaxID=3476 RepID=A0A2P5E2H2_PARAD|nr:hypothetical protein PanWU01x14_009660 [Parasponia andersonii]
MGIIKFKIERFNEKTYFELWRKQIKNSNTTDSGYGIGMWEGSSKCSERCRELELLSLSIGMAHLSWT